MEVAGDGSDHHGPAATAARIGKEIAERSLDDGRCPVFDPDRELAVVPELADLAQRWGDHLFDQFDDRGALVDQSPGDLANAGLVTGHQSVAHSIGLTSEPSRTRRGGGLRVFTSSTDLGEVMRRDEVLAGSELRRKPTVAHPPVRRLVVDPEGIGCGLQFEHGLRFFAHGDIIGHLRFIRTEVD